MTSVDPKNIRTHLATLAIDGLILLRSVQAEFSEALTVVSGKTGAGKSLFLRALLFVLGERIPAAELTDKDSPKARVEAHFIIGDDKTRQALREAGLDEDWDGEEVILQRSLDPSGRSRARINGRMVTLNTLKAVGARLVSVLSQHGYQSLTRAEEQTRILDRFAGHAELAAEFERRRRAALALLAELEDTRDRQERQAEQQRLYEADLACLDELDPREGEFEELGAAEERLRRAEELRGNLLSNIHLLSESEPSVLETLAGLRRRLDAHLPLLPELAEAQESVERGIAELNEALRILERAEQAIDDDPRRLAEVTERRARYRDASRRLRVPPEALFEERERLVIATSEDLAERIRALEGELDRAAAELRALDGELRARRVAGAAALEGAIASSLDNLDLAGMRFEVALAPLGEAPGQKIPEPGGSARVEFRVAANPGDEPRPLASTASGGELSRVMLALQRHLASALDVALLVFDEIDQNVGGRLGSTIGRELAALSGDRQVLVISHLPQVAAYADRHLMAQKSVSRGKAASQIREILGEDRLRELAAMTRGERITKAALAEARELLEEARSLARAP